MQMPAMMIMAERCSFSIFASTLSRFAYARMPTIRTLPLHTTTQNIKYAFDKEQRLTTKSKSTHYSSTVTLTQLAQETAQSM
jgi:hypothetical protein